MSNLLPPKISSSPLPSEHFAQQGDAPSSTALRRVAHAYNQASVHRRKCIFTKAIQPAATQAMTSTSESPWRFVYRQGENVSSVGIIIGMAPASQTSGTNTAYTQLTLNDGSLYSGREMYYPLVQSGAYTPAEVSWQWSEIDVSGSAGTLYEGYITQAYYARVHSVMVYEIAEPVADSSVDGVTDPTNFEQDKPIFDAGIQSLCETGTLLWQHNGSQLLSWTRTRESLAPTITSTSYVNMWDPNYTTVDSDSPGFVLNTEYHDSQKGDVPVEMGILATRTAGSGTCSVKLVDAAGDVIEETAVTTGTTFVSANTITAKAATKTDIHVKVNTGGATWRFDAVCLWEYEA